MRVCSLLPGATELLFYLGLGAHVVGVSHACDYPPEARALPKVVVPLLDQAAASRAIDSQVRAALAAGRSLYAIDRKTLADLRPDLVLSQGLCDVCAVGQDEVRAALWSLPRPPAVLELSPHRLADVWTDVRRVAEALGVPERGEALARGLEARMECLAAQVEAAVAREGRPRVLCLEWIDPPFSAGHWVPDMVRLAGGDPVLAEGGLPSRTLGWQEVAECGADVVVVMACGFDLKRASRELLAALAEPEAKGALARVAAAARGVYVVDARHLFSRPGPRLADGCELLAHVLHPDSVAAPQGAVVWRLSVSVAEETALHGRLEAWAGRTVAGAR